MASLIIPSRVDSPSDEFNVLQTEAQVHCEQVPVNDQDDIPYHAREYAKPFTYGNLPEGFNTSDLNHVEMDDENVQRKFQRSPPKLPSSPLTLRKQPRPSISPSRPVLRKTPSRQEFEEMLMERKEQALRDQNNTAIKLAQNASIQKDLDELQEKLNKKVVFEANVKNGDSFLPHSKASAKASTICSTDLPDIDVDTTNIESQIIVNEDRAEYLPQRAETPAFPSESKSLNDRCVSPYQPMSSSLSSAIDTNTHTELPSERQLNNTFTHLTTEPLLVEQHLVEFAKDSSEFWYKPHITREEAVALLRNTVPGTFLVRNSTTYKNAYGLVLKVDKLPPGVIPLNESNNDEFVRHFLVEPSTRGVRLKGCANEPLFTSLSAFVYEHSINQLALPCKLIIPQKDILQSSGDAELIAAQRQLLMQGAACNVLYLFTCNTESLTGDEAVRKAVYEMYAQKSLPKPVKVHIKIAQQGITLTDNTRTQFFRRHYVAKNISHVGIDPDSRFWSVSARDESLECITNKTIFAFVARPLTGGRDNQCHVFCDLALAQPASAIVSFANKVLPIDKGSYKML